MGKNDLKLISSLIEDIRFANELASDIISERDENLKKLNDLLEKLNMDKMSLKEIIEDE